MSADGRGNDGMFRPGFEGLTLLVYLALFESTILMYTLIASTNRKGSNTQKLTEIYEAILQEYSLKTQILSLQDLPENVLRTDLYGPRSTEFQVLQDKVTQTDKFVFLIPEYNGSFPGVLKVFIDCLEFPGSFAHKKAALVGLSSGTYGNIRGVDHFTGICHYIGLAVLPLRIHIPFIKKEFDAGGGLPEGPTLRFIHQQVHELISF